MADVCTCRSNWSCTELASNVAAASSPVVRSTRAVVSGAGDSDSACCCSCCCCCCWTSCSAVCTVCCMLSMECWSVCCPAALSLSCCRMLLSMLASRLMMLEYDVNDSSPAPLSATDMRGAAVAPEAATPATAGGAVDRERACGGAVSPVADACMDLDDAVAVDGEEAVGGAEPLLALPAAVAGTLKARGCCRSLARLSVAAAMLCLACTLILLGWWKASSHVAQKSVAHCSHRTLGAASSQTLHAPSTGEALYAASGSGGGCTLRCVCAFILLGAWICSKQPCPALSAVQNSAAQSTHSTLAALLSHTLHSNDAPASPTLDAC